jgi:hypothetical protein
MDYSLGLSPLLICDCNIHPYQKLGKRKLQEGSNDTVDAVGNLNPWKMEEGKARQVF